MLISGYYGSIAGAVPPIGTGGPWSHGTFRADGTVWVEG
jgi:hypothetical protein